MGEVKNNMFFFFTQIKESFVARKRKIEPNRKQPGRASNIKYNNGRQDGSCPA